ncbi:uncharacterized protein V6R79_004429 [Siganus canaliculatus]
MDLESARPPTGHEEQELAAPLEQGYEEHKSGPANGNRKWVSAGLKNGDEEQEESAPSSLASSCKLRRKFQLNAMHKSGDVVLGGLFEVHYTSVFAEQTFTSEPIQPTCKGFDIAGFRQAATMAFVIDEINKNSHLLPNVTLGYSLYDNCGTLVIGVSSALSMASGQEEQFLLRQDCLGTPPVLGIVRAMIQILNRFGWTWVGLLVSDDDYGLHVARFFQSELAQSGAGCLAYSEVLPWDNEQSELSRIVDVVKTSTARVVMAFAHDIHLIHLIEEVVRQNVTGRQWIANEVLPTIAVLHKPRFRPYLSGTLAIASRRGEIAGLKEFLLKMRPDQNTNANHENSMVRQFWEDTFQCKFDHAGSLDTGEALCTGQEDIENMETEFLDLSDLRPEYNVYKAVYALVHALDNMLQCEPGKGPFDGHSCATLQRLEPWQLVHYLKAINFTTSLGDQVSFDENGDVLPIFDILNWRWLSDGKTEVETVGEVKRSTPSSFASSCKLRRKFNLNAMHKSGDVVLGGLFEVHYTSVFPEQTFTSEPAQPTCKGFDVLGFRQAQTMAFAINEINRNSNLLPNVTLGYSLYDNCLELGIGFRAALSLVSGQEEQFVFDETCEGTPPVLGIVGDSSSTRSIAISSVLGLYRVPMVSYFATCSCLSDRQKFPSFFRTIPSDAFQVRAMIQILNHFGWTWAGLLISDDDYGIHAAQSFQFDFVQSGEGCLAYVEILPWGNVKSELRKIVNLMKKSTARVVIVFAHESHMIYLMEEVVRQNVTGLQWIASEAWTAATVLHTPHLMPYLAGTLGIAIRRGEIPGLREFALQIRPDPHHNGSYENSMVNQFWEHTFRCRFAPPPAGWLEAGGALCTGQEDLEKVKTEYLDISNLRPEYNVYKAVYALAYALHDMLQCEPGRGPFSGHSCGSLRRLQPWQLLYYLQKVNFTTSFGDQVSFDENGDALPIYDVMNWRWLPDGRTEVQTVGEVKRSAFKGFRQAQTMAFAIDEINRNDNLLSNVTLGYSLYDNCAKLGTGFRAALSLISGQEEQFVFDETCEGTPPVLGIVGDSSSTRSIAISSIFGLYRVPMVRAMIQILKHFGWTWVGLLISDDDYGLHAARSFQSDFVQPGNGCLAYVEILPWDHDKAGLRRIVGIVKKSTALVVIVFAHESYVMKLMEEMKNQNVTGRQWIASEAWTAATVLHTSHLMPYLAGTLGIAIRRGEIPGLREFNLQIRPDPHHNSSYENSMVNQFWEHTFQCRFAPPPAGWVETGGVLCTGQEDLEKVKTEYLDVSDLRPEYNVYKAVYALAYALDELLHCEPGRGPFNGHSCGSLRGLEPWQLLYYLEKVNFTTSFGDQVAFDENGDALPTYDVTNWHWLPHGRTEVQTVGEVKKSASKNEELTIDEDKIFWSFESKKVQKQFQLNGMHQPGDVVLGGLFKINFFSANPDLSFTSEPQHPACEGFDVLGFRQAQTMAFAIDEINRNDNLLSNVTLGYSLYDNCGKLGTGFRAALSLISGQEEQFVFDETCEGTPPVLGIVGDSSSTRSIAISSIFGLYRVPMVSYFATCSCLSDRQKFPSFFRTIPSDAFQVRAMIQILKHFGWTWTGLLISDDDYGLHAARSFQSDFVQPGNGCLAYVEILPWDHDRAGLRRIVGIVKKSTALVVIVFAHESYVMKLMEEVMRQNVTGIQWIASEGWSAASFFQTPQLMPYLAGTLGIAIRRGEIPGLREFTLQIHPDPHYNNSYENSLVNQFWEHTFQCRFAPPPAGWIKAGGALCTGQEDLEKVKTEFLDISDLRPEYNVYKAVYALAYALDELLHCEPGRGPFSGNSCGSLRGLEQWQLLYYLEKVNFTTSFGDQVSFDDKGDALPIYDLTNWHWLPHGGTEVQTVGEVKKPAFKNEELTIDEDKIFWNYDSKKCRSSLPATRFRQAQTMAFAIDEINRNSDLLPNVTLGYSLYDNCGEVGVAFRAALSLVSGQEEQFVLKEKCEGTPPILGIVGDSSSTHSIAISSVFGVYRVPMVSYFATCSCLSDRQKFPSFYRTIPSDAFQVQAMIQILNRFGWTWVGLLISDDDYGLHAARSFQSDFVQSGSGCLAYVEVLPWGYDPTKLKRIVGVMKKSTANVVIVFAHESHMIHLMEEVMRQDVKGLQWIASEGWTAANVFQTPGLMPYLAGTLGIAIRRGEMPGLREFALKIHPDPHHNNSYKSSMVNQFWEHTFQCRFAPPPAGWTEAGGALCTGQEDLKNVKSELFDVSNLRPEYNIYKAVYALAYALHDMLQCEPGRGPFSGNSCGRLRGLKPWQLVHYLKNVNFTTSFGDQVSFDENGDALPIYDVMNWRWLPDGRSEVQTVGEVKRSALKSEELTMNEENIFWNFKSKKVLAAVNSSWQSNEPKKQHLNIKKTAKSLMPL